MGVGEGGQGTREDCLEVVTVVSGCVCPLQELVEYYQCHSLKESFKQLDTTLKHPYKSRERVASRAPSRPPGNAVLPSTPVPTWRCPLQPSPSGLGPCCLPACP